jgi:hypothetical protein
MRHHAQHAVDAEPGVPEAGVGIVLFDFGQRDGHADPPPGTMARRARRCWNEIMARLDPLVDPLLRHLDGVGVSVSFGGVHHVWRRGYLILANITAVADAHARLWMSRGRAPTCTTGVGSSSPGTRRLQPYYFPFRQPSSECASLMHLLVHRSAYSRGDLGARRPSNVEQPLCEFHHPRNSPLSQEPHVRQTPSARQPSDRRVGARSG